MTDNFRILIFSHSFQTHAAHGSGKICTQFRVSVIFSKHELCESAYLTVIGVCRGYKLISLHIPSQCMELALSLVFFLNIHNIKIIYNRNCRTYWDLVLYFIYFFQFYV
jgi:hypothetical protein